MHYTAAQSTYIYHIEQLNQARQVSWIICHNMKILTEQKGPQHQYTSKLYNFSNLCFVFLASCQIMLAVVYVACQILCCYTILYTHKNSIKTVRAGSLQIKFYQKSQVVRRQNNNHITGAAFYVLLEIQSPGMHSLLSQRGTEKQ